MRKRDFKVTLEDAMGRKVQFFAKGGQITKKTWKTRLGFGPVRETIKAETFKIKHNPKSKRGKKHGK